MFVWRGAHEYYICMLPLYILVYTAVELLLEWVWLGIPEYINPVEGPFISPNFESEFFDCFSRWAVEMGARMQFIFVLTHSNFGKYSRRIRVSQHTTKFIKYFVLVVRSIIVFCHQCTTTIFLDQL